MVSKGWTWAELDTRQIALLQESERTLGADILVAYTFYGTEPEPPRKRMPVINLKVAELDESQVELLQGLEENVKAIVIAYSRL